MYFSHLLARCSPLCGQPGGHGGAYGGGVPGLGGAPPCPRGGVRSDDLSRPALVEAMVRGGPELWEAVTSFCEAVMLAKRGGEFAEHLAVDLRLRRRPSRRPVRLTSHDDLQPQ